MRFQDQVVLITGGATGIGRETALALGAQGARLVIGSRNADHGAEVVEAIRAAGGEAIFRPTDVTRPEQVKALVAAAVEQYGALHLAFNNAGIEGDTGPLHELSLEALSEVIDINVKGMLYALKYEVAQMLASGKGAIVNNSSILGLKAMANIAPYVASKFAVTGITRAAALDYASQGIRINAVAPGPIETRMLNDITSGDPHSFARYVPMARIGQPEEVAAAVVWLLSDEASYVTGHTLIVDGGWGAK